MQGGIAAGICEKLSVNRRPRGEERKSRRTLNTVSFFHTHSRCTEMTAKLSIVTSATFSTSAMAIAHPERML